MHNEIVRNLRITIENKEYRGPKKEFLGRSCFDYLLDKLIQQKQSKKGSGQSYPKGKEPDIKYEYFHKKYHPYVGHYFRNLYHIFKFVDNSSLKKSNKKFYTNLIRAQLSSKELIILFFNCLSKFGSNKFKPLIEKYEVLENMPIDPHYISEQDFKKYDIKAFGNAEIPNFHIGKMTIPCRKT